MPQAYSVDQSLKRAQRALKQGDANTAEALLSDVLQRFPGNRRARHALEQINAKPLAELVAEAQWLEKSNAMDAAERVWLRAFDRSPQTESIALGLIECRLALGRAAHALGTADRLLAHHPDLPAGLDAKGRALRDLGRLEEAEACHLAALRDDGADAAPLNHLGILAQARGDRPGAEGYYRRALALCPDKPDLHHNLSATITYHPGEGHLAALHDQIACADPDDPQKAPLHFAMFKALDDLDEPQAAFAHLQKGNALRKAWHSYDVRRDATRFAFCKALLASNPTVPKLPPAKLRPIFVVGLPRSGTTLVERILSQAPDTQACGELSVVSTAAARVLRAMQIQKSDHIDPDTLTTFRAEVFEGLSAFSNGAPVLIDKMPLNFRWAGLICAAIPEARIVHLERDPIAVAWSLYRHLFAGRGNGFAYDLAEITAYMALHRDLMRAWKRQFDAQITSLPYSDLVASPESTIRSLIETCELDWSDDCLSPHMARNTVLTASASQVRKPIHDAANDGWRRYQTQLAPLLTALRAGGILH